jgi:hypothetical protein
MLDILQITGIRAVHGVQAGASPRSKEYQIRAILIFAPVAGPSERELSGLAGK